MKGSLLLPVIATLAGCVTGPPRVSNTLWPQAIIAAPKSVISERLIGLTASVGGTIESANETLIQARVADPQAGMAKAFFGCASCADPYLRLNFVLSSVGDQTQVVAQYWQVIPKAFGAEERMEINGNADYNKAQEMLWKLRDQYATQ